MIPRYSRPEMARIWSEENRYRIWFEIEAHACDAQAELGVIPESGARAVWQRGAFEIERIDEIEREVDRAAGGGFERIGIAGDIAGYNDRPKPRSGGCRLATG